MIAWIILAAYIAIGLRVAEPVARREWQSTPSISGDKDPFVAILMLVMVTCAWPIAWPIVRVWERIRRTVDTPAAPPGTRAKR